MDIKGRVALTGRPGVGKTTLIERVIERLGIDAGGMVTKEIRTCGHRVGFSVVDVGTGEEGVLAHIHHQGGPRMGRYCVNVRDLETIGLRAIERSLERGCLTVIDEVAPMEITSPGFVPLIERALESGVPLLVSTHAHLQHAIVHRVRRELTLVRVRMGNRDRLVEEVSALLIDPETAPEIASIGL
ncbi:MAG: NTPase [Candidatus Bipolaricaulota bacterium]|nr:MAG: NTPase [Candidatus Bipolaricaulota bacterium]